MSNSEYVIIPKDLVKDTMALLDSLDHHLAKVVSVKLNLPDEVAIK